jgi:LacI family transcriptional regulator
MLKKRPTLKDIAIALNVSTTTVSRALNNKEDISKEMRKKVWDVAKMLDYKPNTLARSLRQKSSNKVIGAIIPEVDHYFLSTIIKGITSSIDAEYLIMIGESRHNPEMERKIINRFVDHFVGGIILIPTKHDASKRNIHLLQEAHIPHILVGRTFETYEGSFLRHDSFHGAEVAIDHLVSKGHKRIALFKGADECTVSKDRLAGYKKSLSMHNIDFDDSLIITCPNACREEAFVACEQLFRLKQPPTAIFTITDHLAAGIYQYASAYGLNIPDDISVVGYSNSDLSDILHPKLTTVAQDGFELGRIAKEQMIKIIDDPAYAYKNILSSSLIVRDSS